MLLQSLSKVWIVFSFTIHQEEIARTLCVKKEVEENTCQGNCHLKKQIDQAEEQEEGQTPKLPKENLEVAYYHLLQPLQFLSHSQAQSKHIYAREQAQFNPSEFLSEIFHPPQASLFSC